MESGHIQTTKAFQKSQSITLSETETPLKLSMKNISYAEPGSRPISRGDVSERSNASFYATTNLNATLELSEQ